MTRRWTALATAALLLAACGSTVGLDKQQALDGRSDTLGDEEATLGDVDGDGVAGGVGDAGVDPVGGPSSEEGAVGSSSSGSRSARGGASSAEAQATVAAAGGRSVGVTDTQILLGVSYATNGSEANEASGAGAATSTDTRRATELVIKDLNDRGGIHGRKVVPVWHALDALAAKTYEQHGQEMCATWTEDNKVFAALGAPYESLRQCMENAGAPMTYTSLSGSSELTFKEYPLYFEPGNLNLNRIGRHTVESLVRRKFFPANARIGLLTFDDPYFRHAMTQSMHPALARHGLKPTDTVYVPSPESTSDLGGISAGISSAVLRFRANQVSHVLILDQAAVATFLFMQEAESQGFRPRYGLNTQNGNTALSDLLASSGSQDQLINSLSIGWAPSLDLSEADDPNDKASPLRRRCLKILEDGGLNSFSSRNAMG
ncbi:MAG: ABC transporter substrate-binding protein, partial [Acidimicrobiia bacterium]